MIVKSLTVNGSRPDVISPVFDLNIYEIKRLAGSSDSDTVAIHKRLVTLKFTEDHHVMSARFDGWFKYLFQPVRTKCTAKALIWRDK